MMSVVASILLGRIPFKVSDPDFFRQSNQFIGEGIGISAYHAHLVALFRLPDLFRRPHLAIPGPSPFRMFLHYPAGDSRRRGTKPESESHPIAIQLLFDRFQPIRKALSANRPVPGLLIP